MTFSDEHEENQAGATEASGVAVGDDGAMDTGAVLQLLIEVTKGVGRKARHHDPNVERSIILMMG